MSQSLVIFFFLISVLVFAILQMMRKLLLQQKKIVQLNHEKVLLGHLIDYIYQNINSKELLAAICSLIKLNLNIVEILFNKRAILLDENLNIDFLLKYIEDNKFSMFKMLQNNTLITYSYRDENDTQYNLYVIKNSQIKEDYIIYVSKINNKNLSKFNIERLFESLSNLLITIEKIQNIGFIKKQDSV
jgi:hypothetical protein